MSKPFERWFYALLFSGVCGFLFVMGSINHGWFAGWLPAAHASPAPQEGQGEPPLGAGEVRLGGVTRKSTDYSGQSRFIADAPPNISHPEKKRFRAKVNPASNLQAKSVVDAVTTKKNPERYSLLSAATPYDPAKKADYLKVAEPGRVFQPKQPGEGVKRIVARGPRYFDILLGESVTLSTIAAPACAVTYTSFGGGIFGSTLATETVEANAEGLAEVTFTASEGVTGDVNILVASPETSSRVKYLVHVSAPHDASATR